MVEPNRPEMITFFESFLGGKPDECTADAGRSSKKPESAAASSVSPQRQVEFEI